MKTILHDLEDTSILELESASIIDAKGCKNCIGCFKCWTDSDTCCIKDKYFDNGKKLLDSDELIIISKCTNGCYSSDIKRVLERSISYVEPYFTIRNGEIHHKTKTKKRLDLTVHFYKENISKEEKEVASSLVKRNALNLNTNVPVINFYDSYKEIVL